MMKHIAVLCCILAAVVAKDKKISLEDIERDNLKTNQKTVQQNVPQGSPTDYGFLPVKTVADYARQEPKEQYYQPQYIPQQQYSAAPQQYYYQQQPSSQYQQYENVQYVTDNSIAPQPQQYYTPQYVYLQQYTAPSTAIQTVVDPKGGVQYVMYIPTYATPKGEQTQNYENIVYANQESSQTYQVPETQYVTKYVTPQQEVTPSIQYAPQVSYSSKGFGGKGEPKSLLDSYIPSILQVQYYKQQQQARDNAILQQQSLKLSKPITGKVEYVKSYRPTQSQTAESVANYNYQIPTTYHK